MYMYLTLMWCCYSADFNIHKFCALLLSFWNLFSPPFSSTAWKISNILDRSLFSNFYLHSDLTRCENATQRSLSQISSTIMRCYSLILIKCCLHRVCCVYERALKWKRKSFSRNYINLWFHLFINNIYNLEDTKY